MTINKFKIITNPIINYLGEKKIAKRFSNIPIIIGGCGRSGTTLLLAILDAHPHIYGLPIEIGQFTEWDKIDGKYLPRRMDRLHRFLVGHRIPKSCTRWCEKTPKNVLYYKRIIDYYNGNIKIINLVRDGRDVLLSRHPEDPNKYWIPIHRWVNDIKLGLEVNDYPQVYTVRYEDLVSNYKNIIQGICDFIGEDSTGQILDWFEHTNVRNNTAWFQSVQKIHTQSVGKWKKEENKSRIEEILNYPEVPGLLKKLEYL